VHNYQTAKTSDTIPQQYLQPEVVAPNPHPVPVLSAQFISNIKAPTQIQRSNSHVVGAYK